MSWNWYISHQVLLPCIRRASYCWAYPICCHSRPTSGCIFPDQGCPLRIFEASALMMKGSEESWRIPAYREPNGWKPASLHPAKGRHAKLCNPKRLYVFSSFKSASISLFYRFSCNQFLRANFKRFDRVIAFSNPWWFNSFMLIIWWNQHLSSY